MIESFADTDLRRFFVEDRRSRRIPPEIADRLFRKLQMLDDATTDADLRVPPSHHFERLKGRLQERCSIRVNDRWCLVFYWSPDTGNATDLYLDDHSYR